MHYGKLKYGRAIVNTYDHIDDEVIREIACHVGIRSCDAAGDISTEETMSIFRVAHVQVWRQERKMKEVLQSLWDKDKEVIHKRLLISRGLTLQDADDVLQSATLRSIVKFHEWKPWVSSYWTWLGWWCKKYATVKFKDSEGKISIDDDVAQSDFFVYVENPMKEDDPASKTLDMAIEEMRKRGFWFYKEAATLLETARSMGDDFRGFTSAEFQERTGLSRTTIQNKMKKADTRGIVAECVRAVYGSADMIPPLELPSGEPDVSMVRGK